MSRILAIIINQTSRIFPNNELFFFSELYFLIPQTVLIVFGGTDCIETSDFEDKYTKIARRDKVAYGIR